MNTAVLIIIFIIKKPHKEGKIVHKQSQNDKNDNSISYFVLGINVGYIQFNRIILAGCYSRKSSG